MTTGENQKSGFLGRGRPLHGGYPGAVPSGVGGTLLEQFYQVVPAARDLAAIPFKL